MSRQPVGARLALGLPSPNLLSPSVSLHPLPAGYCILSRSASFNSSQNHLHFLFGFFLHQPSSSSCYFFFCLVPWHAPSHFTCFIFSTFASMSTFLIPAALCYPDQPLLPPLVFLAVLLSLDIVYICLVNHWQSLSRPHRCCNNTGGLAGLTLGLIWGVFSDHPAVKSASSFWIWPFFLFHSALRFCSPTSLWFVIFFTTIWCVDALMLLLPVNSMLGLKCCSLLTVLKEGRGLFNIRIHILVTRFVLHLT